MCVEACPFDTLKLAKPGIINLLERHFYTKGNSLLYVSWYSMCSCLSNRCTKYKICTKWKKKIRYFKAQMGVAVIDDSSCIAFGEFNVMLVIELVHF